jgi:ribosome-associated translation inhibitor RaiA
MKFSIDQLTDKLHRQITDVREKRQSRRHRVDKHAPPGEAESAPSET